MTEQSPPTSLTGPPFRRVALYTAELTPRFEIAEEYRAVLDPILFDQAYEPGKYREAYPWFFRLNASDQTELLTYCEELDCLHEDLEFALFDLETAFELSYRDDPYNQRLASLYHMDNVDHRVFAYREKLYKLIDCFLGREAGRRDAPGVNFNDAVRGAVQERGWHGVVRVLRTLVDDTRISSSLQRRKLFVHRLARRTWPMMKSSQRVTEQFAGVGPVTELEQFANLGPFAKEQSRQINALCESLANFRFELVRELKAAGR